MQGLHQRRHLDLGVVVHSLSIETSETGQSLPFQNENTEYKSLLNKYNKDEKDIDSIKVRRKQQVTRERRVEEISIHKHKHTE